MSSKAITTPEPSEAPAARVAFERERQVELVGSDERPRGAAEQHRLQRPAVAHATGEVEHLAEGGAELHLVDAGRATHPDRQNRRVPVESAVPVAAKAAPPSSTMRRTLTSVSTLLTTVGLPNSPRSTGNGGLLRGSPR